MERSRRKTKEGIVLSNKMDKTVTVRVTRRIRNPQYGKIEDRWKKYYVHDDRNELRIGQKVRIMEMRPLSKTKKWRVVEVVEEART